MTALLSQLSTALKRLGLLALVVVMSFGLAACDGATAKATSLSADDIAAIERQAEGFLAARLLTEALERAGANPTRQDLVNAFEAIGQLDLGGFRISLGPRDHQASDFVDLTFLGAQRWAP